MISFAIVGAGWRTDFYLRIAQALPEIFKVVAVVVRNKDKHQDFVDTWHVPAVCSIDELSAYNDIEFVVTSLPWAVNPDVVKQLAEKAIPVLSETPPAPDLAGLNELYKLVEGGAKIQVAEQLNFQPHHAARLEVARSGLLGDIQQAQVSCCHGYHGISIMRALLGKCFESVTISAKEFHSQIINSPGRDGVPEKEALVDSRQVIATFTYDDVLGISDFCDDQYFSFIRGQRFLVRGTRGEIVDDSITYLQDPATPIKLNFHRHDAGHNGNLEGYYHKGIQAGENWYYKNPFPGACFSDEEIAIATALQGMHAYLQGGPEVYSLAEACQDHYLTLLCQESIEAGGEVRSVAQSWST